MVNIAALDFFRNRAILNSMYNPEEPMAFTTRGSLLAAVKKGDEISWEKFYDMYKPLILLKGSDLQLNQTEKEELVQLVMLSFFNTSKTFRYDKSKGRFRDYFKRVIHNKACDLMRKRHDGEVSVEEIPQTVENLLAEGDDRWEEEWKNHILNQALEDLRGAVSPLVYQAFYMLTLENMSGKEVAETLGISANAVYVYKHDAQKKLKELIAETDNV